MLDDKKLLNFIKDKCKELGVTGYDIGKNTSISEQSAYKILDGTTENPRRKNMIKILEYLESKVMGTEINVVAEPKEEYKNYTEATIFEKYSKLQEEHISLMHENHQLKQLLEKNNIAY